MRHLLLLLILASGILIHGCSVPPQQQAAPLPEYDTVQSLMATDTGNFRKLSLMMGPMEAQVHIQKILSQNTFQPYIRISYGYDDNLNVLLAIRSVYDSSLNDYVHTSRQEFEYNALNKPTLVTEYRNKRHGWIPIGRKAFTYDSRGIMASEETYKYLNGKWTITGKVYYKYDARLNVTELTSYRADSLGVWYPVQKIQREYSDTLPVLEVVSGPGANNQWVPVSKQEHSYNVQNLRQTSISYKRMGGRWIYNVKSTYTYGDDGAVTGQGTSFYDEQSSSWKYQGMEKF